MSITVETQNSTIENNVVNDQSEGYGECEDYSFEKSRDRRNRNIKYNIDVLNADSCD